MIEKHQDIGIITFPICETGNAPDDTRAGNVPFSNLVDILYHFSDNLYVITGNKERVIFRKEDSMHIVEVKHNSRTGFISRVINYVLTQLKLSIQLAKLSGRVNLWIFFIGAESLILPMLTVKLLRRQAILAITGFPAQVIEEEKTLLFKIINLLAGLNLMLANRIITYSQTIVIERNLEKYQNKITFAHEHFLDFDTFSPQKPLSQRDSLIAYIGRLEEGKGITNFLEALAILSEKKREASFLIGGEGPLRDKVEEYSSRPGTGQRVEFAGWILHDELPKYLNEVKLLVLPSYTEALPNIILEAMACGTPVLTTVVGAIPDIVKDGETGFIMKDNSSNCIAENIIRALEHPDLEQIADNAHALVEQEYTYEAAIKKFEPVLAI
ncbi:glycosyltransferase family 4 protein [Chloroflexota bacterium]